MMDPATRPVLVAELTHNHNGDFARALDMVDAACAAGADAIKIQCRTLPDAIPPAQRTKRRAVPWTGEEMSYLEYRALCEFSDAQIEALHDRTRSHGREFFASAFDAAQVPRLTQLIAPRYHKVPSACATDLELLRVVGATCRASGATAIVSTGGCTWAQIDAAIEALGPCPLWLGQCTAIYPCPPAALNLRAIPEMARRYPHAVVGFSNHAASIAPMLAALGMGARWIEAHFTLSRTLPGTDHAASFEPQGLAMLRRYADTVQEALGSGLKVPLPEEVETMSKLRRFA